MAFLFLASLPLYAGTTGDDPAQKYPWFASIGRGYSWTILPGIVNPNPAQWDYSTQGYDSSLGNRGFNTFALGKHLYKYVDVSLSYLDNENFFYEKYQTGTSNTDFFTGAIRTRFFQLINRSIIANVTLRPEKNYIKLSSLEFSPFIGAGIGYGQSVMDGFRTQGIINVDGTLLTPTDSTGETTNSNSLAWQGFIGVNVRPSQSHVSIDFGYQYYDGGKFYGPKSIYSNGSGWFPRTPWSGEVLANQLFVSLKYTT